MLKGLILEYDDWTFYHASIDLSKFFPFSICATLLILFPFILFAEGSNDTSDGAYTTMGDV